MSSSQPPSLVNSNSQPGTSSTTPGTSGFLTAPSITQGQSVKYSSPHTVVSSQTPPATFSSSPPIQPSTLRQRHTLQVPAVSTKNRTSTGSITDSAISSGRFSPTATTAPRRASMSLGRRGTRLMDNYVDEIPQDEDAAKAAEAIIAKRESKRRRKVEEEDDKVLVGTKVDINHANWITAYNMLTGIRFVVSRINAKMFRPLTDADFDAKHKFSFDITGNELTPSAKYDFKFKDYSPWVFRHLRQSFGLDPADYLMSLTSKYILSELGSPGKSGSFFYFSRDYKYIIKTIRHGEHLFLRRNLKEYYQHVTENPNTLVSQFYGLHRVKTPFGRKIHFVVMNNLFPPHRDIHQTYDLKGSTIGRDYSEVKLLENPRATMKDLNWLRRDMHLELGPAKKRMFLEQVEKDVRLLQKMGVMDYSLLIGTHDLNRGNKDDIRNNALKVFQPGASTNVEDDLENVVLARTPSKLENARRIRELRKVINKEVPVTLDRSANRLPDEYSENKNSIFYNDDGGLRATHETDEPGDVIYYLGIIDCLTHYGFIKKAEHLWKGLTAPKNEISVNPPGSYGDRFFKFISSVVKSPEEVIREKEARRESNLESGPVAEVVTSPAWREGESGERDGANETSIPQRKQSAMRPPSMERQGGATILPIVEEAAEGSSGRSLSRNGSGSDSGVEESAAISAAAARRSGAGEGGREQYAKHLPDRSFQIRHKYHNTDDLSFRVATVSS
ncbi:SAICAR synthase-like protein [Terfezia boudieri ATCC MYA-4762]|uniref:1-phosphatidylinositol-4-phosphate 5-kinase n=1 Tax=Terfezia boudieri ATCC MYA-4762 TaxID=1051890 RepID=A0A3N4LID6_9PEZI|nr:SAICAR synthase-like protein [Terfezia boudieri ATCC MYA-4762]